MTSLKLFQYVIRNDHFDNKGDGESESFVFFGPLCAKIVFACILVTNNTINVIKNNYSNKT